MLQERINLLKKDLVDFASLIEKMLHNGVSGLIKSEEGVLQQTISVDEDRANEFDLLIDNLCTNLIAQFEPKALNLRTILMILKMGNDLERMGDHSVNIAQSGLFLLNRPQLKPMLDLSEMAKLVETMLRNSITAFINFDPVLAKTVCQSDDDVDDFRDNILQNLVVIMREDNNAIERAMHIMRIARELERIADLTTNICEDVVYMVEGKVAKHNAADK